MVAKSFLTSASVVAVLLALFQNICIAQGSRSRPVAYDVPWDLQGKKSGRPATDISGIACMPAAGEAPLSCLLVNDENASAQFVTVSNRRLIAGDVIPLLGNRPDSRTLGTEPQVSCAGGRGDFKEFDGEGVAFAAPYYYVVGSHGCSRNTGEFRLSSFILARIEVKSAMSASSPGQSARSVVETTYRLSDVLGKASEVAPYFGKALTGQNGLNVEGLAADDSQLFIGLRAPSIDGNAYIVKAKTAELFAEGHDPAVSAPEVIPVAVGVGAGIRDLAMLPDGRLLVLTGPAQNEDIRAQILRVEARPRGKVETLRELMEAGPGTKAEAMAVLSYTKNEVRVLVLFDGVVNGGPLEYRIVLE